ncbi:hypothetical protein BJ875DRAFT_148823 [Amylocarpus encephaloides]|uniref:DUF5672 domain-containing protein n=1 Tax=Amylocarpus encephaloides TaxID=45428 RepID=A0A9P7YPB0_9HELO|nr:hypothetical protein BJ875DRAFT_148823 [Amylocarpus encephaloides]
MLDLNISISYFVLSKASMIKLWQGQGRRGQFFSSGMVLTILIVLFYYVAWVKLVLPTTYDKTNTAISESIAQSVDNYPPISALSCPPSPIPKPTPQPSPYDPTKVAFLVETRPLPHLPALFAHMTSVIPSEWTFRFMGTLEVIEFMRSYPLLLRLEKAGKLTFLDLPSNYTLEDRQTISQMFTDDHLYRDILAPAEHLLVFQPDSIFCAASPRTLNDFLEYDWIGAAWAKDAQYGGNGGLSLRKVSKILQVLEKDKRKHGDGALEDLWLSDRLNRLPNSRMAVANVSKTFSVESVWDDAPLGYHVGWLGVHHEQVCFLGVWVANILARETSTKSLNRFGMIKRKWTIYSNIVPR